MVRPNSRSLVRGMTRRRAGRRQRILQTSPVNAGEYSRTYSEKNYGRNRSREHEEEVSQSIEKNTRVTLHRNAQGLPLRPTGSHILTVRNQTLSIPTGRNLSSEFSNVTYFNGEEGVGGRSRPDSSPIHPLTQYTNLLFDYRTKDRGMSKL